MRKSPRGGKESGKEMRRQKVKKDRIEKFKKKERMKKEINK